MKNEKYLVKNICNTFSIKIQTPHLKHTIQVNFFRFFCSEYSWYFSTFVYCGFIRSFERGLFSIGLGTIRDYFGLCHSPTHFVIDYCLYHLSLGMVNFIQKKLSKKSYPQISDVNNFIQKFYPNLFYPKCTWLILRHFILLIFLLDFL